MTVKQLYLFSETYYSYQQTDIIRKKNNLELDVHGQGVKFTY